MSESSFRKEKLEEQILQDMNLFLRKEIKDPRLTFVSLTKVELSKDYAYAKVYWDTFNPELKEGIKDGLEHATPRLRSLLGKNLKIRHIPSLNFYYDAQYEAERGIEQILEKEKKLSGQDQDS